MLYVSEVSLEGVRKFENRTFRFRPGINILIGENGAGKTTILRALESALSKRKDSFFSALSDEDIRLRAKSLSVKVTLSTQPGSISTSSTYNKRFGRMASRKAHELPFTVLGYGAKESVCRDFETRKIKRFEREKISNEMGQEEWLYESSRDVPLSESDTTRFGSAREVRKLVRDTLRRFNADFIDFNWAFIPQDCSIKLPGKQWPDGEAYTRLRQNLRTAVMRYIQESSGKLRWGDRRAIVIASDGRSRDSKFSSVKLPQFTDLMRMLSETTKIDPIIGDCVAEITLTPRIQIQTSDGVLLLSQLSDGEQRIFSLIVDIARQLTRRGNAWENHRRSAALVLIDELDVHLHPRWQREIVATLTETFPTCQFIATTHSPFVIQSANPGQVQHLERHISGGFTNRGIEEIALRVMGIEDHEVSPRYMEMLKTAREYFKVLSSAEPGQNTEDTKQLKARLDRLSSRYAENPAYQAYLEIHKGLILGRESELR